MLGIVVAPQFLARLQGYRVEQLAPLLLPLSLATLARAAGLVDRAAGSIRA
jgi:hypothetical protein